MKQIEYLKKLATYVLGESPLWYLSILLTFVSVGSEVLAVASLYPLSLMATGSSLSPNLFVVRQLSWLGISASLRSLLIVFLALFAFRIATNLLNQSFYLFLGRKTFADLSHQSFRAILKKETIRSIEDKSAGHFISLSGDESFRASTIVVTLVQLLNSIVLSTLYYFAIIKFSGIVALSLFAFLTLNALVLVPIFRHSHRLGVHQVELNRSTTTLFLDALNGLRSVRAFSGEDYMSDGYRDLIYRYSRTLFLVDFVPLLAKALPALILLGSCISIVLLVPGSAWTSIDVAFIITLIAFIMRFLPAIGTTVTIFMRLLSDARAGKDVTHLVESARMIAPDTRPKIDGRIDSIEIRSIRFYYNKHIDVLRNLNLSFERGKSYAIVGESGAGKSTLLDLILRFHVQNDGEILLNGNAINGVSESSLRSKILLLGQQTTILNDSVRNNIAFGYRLTDEVLRKATKLAAIDRLINDLPEGYETLLAYQGSNLSGGQRQRIGLARALSRDPDVLILDEVTSALDSETRNQVVSNVIQEFRDKILIFVTHDDFVKNQVNHVVKLDRIAKEIE